jgi:diphosphoinositol-polyphosphate diphosphatase
LIFDFLKVLLITSHRDKSLWIFPGGGIEPNESQIDAAHRELYEEAGVKGRILRELGVFENRERKHRTTVFVVFVEEEYDDWDDKRLIDRQRHWYKSKDAFSLLTNSKPSQLTFFEQFISTSPNRINLLHQLSS